MGVLIAVMQWRLEMEMNQEQTLVLSYGVRVGSYLTEVHAAVMTSRVRRGKPVIPLATFIQECAGLGEVERVSRTGVKVS